MRLFLLLMILPIILVSRNKDSLANSHYKVKFSIQGKYLNSQFDYTSSYNQIEFHKTYYSGYHSNYEGKVKTDYTFNPEFKIDFELPLWLKFSCGFSHSKIKFKTISDRLYYNREFIYDPASTNWNPIVIGSNTSDEVVGYNIDESEIVSFGTFVGIGFSKQYSRFNFDIDYFFSMNKVTEGFTVRKIYDNNNAYERTESFNLMSNYLHQSGRRIFIHNFSTSISYRLYKNINFKVGYQYSKNDNDINDDTYPNYATFKKVRCQSFVFGVCFSII